MSEAPFPGLTKVRVTYPGSITIYHDGLTRVTQVDEPQVVEGLFHGYTRFGGRDFREGSLIYEDTNGQVHVVSPDIVEFL